MRATSIASLWCKITVLTVIVSQFVTLVYYRTTWIESAQQQRQALRPWSATERDWNARVTLSPDHPLFAVLLHAQRNDLSGIRRHLVDAGESDHARAWSAAAVHAAFHGHRALVEHALAQAGAGTDRIRAAVDAASCLGGAPIESQSARQSSMALWFVSQRLHAPCVKQLLQSSYGTHSDMRIAASVSAVKLATLSYSETLLTAPVVHIVELLMRRAMPWAGETLAWHAGRRRDRHWATLLDVALRVSTGDRRYIVLSALGSAVRDCHVDRICNIWRGHVLPDRDFAQRILRVDEDLLLGFYHPDDELIEILRTRCSTANAGTTPGRTNKDARSSILMQDGVDQRTVARFEVACATGDAPAVDAALAAGGIPGAVVERALVRSAADGHLSTLKRILPHIAESSVNMALAEAMHAARRTAKGSMQVARWLLAEMSDAALGQALLLAADANDVDFIDDVIAVMEPTLDGEGIVDRELAHMLERAVVVQDGVLLRHVLHARSRSGEAALGLYRAGMQCGRTGRVDVLKMVLKPVGKWFMPLLDEIMISALVGALQSSLYEVAVDIWRLYSDSNNRAYDAWEDWVRYNIVYEDDDDLVGTYVRDTSKDDALDVNGPVPHLPYVSRPRPLRDLLQMASRHSWMPAGCTLQNIEARMIQIASKQVPFRQSFKRAPPPPPKVQRSPRLDYLIPDFMKDRFPGLFPDWATVKGNLPSEFDLLEQLATYHFRRKEFEVDEYIEERVQKLAQASKKIRQRWEPELPY
ncbi:hypothetical protein PBRA_007915 [Plasmodiophora brassicae]|nr:hypothetical protein PBRA_007915 [Plasmodiophora brassicae]